MTHELKTWPAMFDAIERGEKTCEIRRDDRGYASRDLLRLRRYDPVRAAYTGEELRVVVTHIVRGPDYGLPAGLCVMSIERTP